MEINNKKVYIGLFYLYDYTEFITLDDLKQYIEKNPNNKYKLEDYLDCRKSVDMQRFKFCPFTGTKIDWKKMRDNSKNER